MARTHAMLLILPVTAPTAITLIIVGAVLVLARRTRGTR
jgi:hypothetical protein